MVKLGCLKPDGYVNLRHRDIMAGLTALLLSILATLRNWLWGSPLRGIAISEKLAKAWFKVNCSRLHIQEDVNLEDLNLEAMGLINDAKCMMESLIEWKNGMTSRGKLCILDSISLVAGNVFLVLCELERWLSQVAEQTGPAVL